MPEMDRPSIALARVLDGIVVYGNAIDSQPMMLCCDYCGGVICDIEDGDTMRVLLNTALAHVCET